jgi:hypothetical protein
MFQLHKRSRKVGCQVLAGPFRPVRTQTCPVSRGQSTYFENCSKKSAEQHCFGFLIIYKRHWGGRSCRDWEARGRQGGSAGTKADPHSQVPFPVLLEGCAPARPAPVSPGPVHMFPGQDTHRSASLRGRTGVHPSRADLRGQARVRTSYLRSRSVQGRGIFPSEFLPVSIRQFKN